ncbi:hypothetical protein MRX96_047223 [Rhipicephalus microplus]
MPLGKKCGSSVSERLTWTLHRRAFVRRTTDYVEYSERARRRTALERLAPTSNTTSYWQAPHRLQSTSAHVTHMTPSSGASSSHGAANEHDTTSAVGDGDTDLSCGGEYEAPMAVGFKRKSPSDSQHFEGAENHTQEPKRARLASRKIDVIEEMVDKLTNKTKRLFDTLLIRLNESDAERNAQYAVVTDQLAVVNKRIEYLERGTAQLQQHEQGQDKLGGDASTILNRSNSGNTTHTEKGGTHGQSRSPNTFQ